jgi:hypothetical protein
VRLFAFPENGDRVQELDALRNPGVLTLQICTDGSSIMALMLHRGPFDPLIRHTIEVARTAS